MRVSLFSLVLKMLQGCCKTFFSFGPFSCEGFEKVGLLFRPNDATQKIYGESVFEHDVSDGAKQNYV